MTPKLIFEKINHFFLDILFPVRCLVCKNYGTWICDKCLEEIKLIENQVCPYCEKNLTPSGRICSSCKINFQKNLSPSLDSLLVATRYSDQNISSFVHLFKYRFVSDLYMPLGKLIIKSILQTNLALPDIIVPIPLHKRRLRWRGFNQAELLANFIGKNLTPGLEILVMNNLILRKKYAKPQMKIKKYQDRKKNVKNVFVLNQDKINLVVDRSVLLVDDVATTGATLFECAKMLKGAGAKKIHACVIARQQFS